MNECVLIRICVLNSHVSYYRSSTGRDKFGVAYMATMSINMFGSPIIECAQGSLQIYTIAATGNYNG